MGLGCVVAAYAGVKLVAASVLDGNDVEWRRPMGTLRQWGDGEAEHWRGGKLWTGGWHGAVMIMRMRRLHELHEAMVFSS